MQARKIVRRHSRARILCATTAIALAVIGPVPTAAAEPVKVVRSIDDLPRYNYPVSGRLADLFENDAAFRPIGEKVRTDTETTLADYRIEDRTTLRSLHRVLLDLALLRGDAVVARQEIAAIRPLQDKEADKLTIGLREAAYLDALAAGPADSTAFRSRFQASYAAALAPLPWAIVGSKVQESAGMAPVTTRIYLSGISDARLQPAATSGKAIDGTVAAQLISLTVQYRLYTPLTAEIVAALRGYIARNAVVKPDIWAARTAVLPPVAKLTPVTVAIWDVGVDTDLFKGRLWTNPAEIADGKDDDGNGYIDDIHGVAYGIDGKKEIAPLNAIPAEIAPRLDATRLLMQGMLDQRAGIDSADARHLRDVVASASPEAMKRSFADSDFYLYGYAHGTLVASVAAKDNPAIRLLVARLEFDWSLPPRRPTEATATARAKMYQHVVDYMRRAGVRVVNMSWGIDIKSEYEDLLAANGVPAGERETEARRLFAIDGNALRDAIASAPDILFVCAAGNADDSASFSGVIPASIDSPNVLTVAAVDQAGEPTGFTSGGPSVDIAANGYQVDSIAPGGIHQRWSGTSLASPAVVNAAAKLLAVDPKLSVAELRGLLLDTATPGAGGLRLLDTKAAMSRVKTQ